MLEIVTRILKPQRVILLCFMFVSFVAFGQQTVTGLVTNESGEPIPGVNVVIKGTTKGTVTDVNGNFSIQAGASDVLVISYVGSATQEIAVGSRTTVDIQLANDATALQELVVVGYTSQSKELVTGAMSQIDTKQALALPIVNAGQALQGRASGVHVVGGGQPGTTPLIRIRGFGTTNDNGPLYVIDGMQTTDPNVLAQINPNDIESINVLKDASAAIYGARASNGVIIVTTKSGIKGDKPLFSFNSYVGIQKVGKLQEMLNSQQMGEVIWQSFKNTNAPLSHPQYGTGPEPVIPTFIRGTDALPYDPVTNKITRASQGTDWQNEIFETAPIQNYDLSLQGGGTRSKYLVALGYQNAEGIQIHTGFERYATRINTEFDVTDNIRFGEHLSLAYTDQLAQNQIGLAQATPPLVPVYDEGGNFGGSGPSTSSGLSNTNNPVAELIRGKDNFNRNLRLLGDAYLEGMFLKNFTVRTTIGVTYNDNQQNFITRKNPEAPEPRATNTLREINGVSNSWVWTNTLRWSKTIGDHSLNALAGLEALSQQNRINDMNVRDFLLEDPDYIIPVAGTSVPTILPTSVYDKSTLYSYFFNADYAFKGKYLATFSLRRDRSSRFASGYNTGVFPSGSIGWIISEEEFLKSVSFISRLKLRASYGLLGNQDVPRTNPYLNRYAAQQEIGFYPIGGNAVSTGAVLTFLGTPDLQWETSRQFNVGFDLALFNNDLNLSFDVFDRDTKDMIVIDPLPTTSIDALSPFINAGEVNNRGVDISASYGNTSKQSPFKWNVGINVSAYKNKVVKLNGDNPNAFLLGSVFRSGVITRTSKGLPISYYYGREVIGIFQDVNEVAAAPSQGFATSQAGVGRFRYKDANDDGVINDLDRVVLGNPHPDFTYGININLGYNRFFATLFFQGVQGNEVYNFTKIGTDFPSFFNSNRSTRVLDSWSESNRDAKLPALHTSIVNNESQPNSYFVEDGSYMRLRNLQIGYNFDLPKLGVKNAQIYLQGINLFMITDYLGADPEMGTGNAGDDPNPPSMDLTIGVDQGRYPIAKSYLLGLKFSF
jgi:TonB-dependent starch-binding outer membrane protein SusC